MKISLSLTLAAGLLLTAVVARADHFFVANFGVNSITKYNASGNGSSFTNAFVNGPNGIALDVGGNLYVTTNQNTIEKFAPDGTDLGVFASTGLNNALGLAFDRAGNLYAANFAGNTVEKFAPDGTDLGVFASVIRATGIAFDAAGNLYVANFGNTIERFSPSGAALGSFATTGLNNPEGLAFDSLGKLYVANNGSDTIEVYSPAGVDLGPLPVPSASFRFIPGQVHRQSRWAAGISISLPGRMGSPVTGRCGTPSMALRNPSSMAFSKPSTTPARPISLSTSLRALTR